MEIVEITDPAVLSHLVVQELLERAFPEDSLAVPGGLRGAPEEFVDMVLDPAFHVLVGVEQGLLKAVAILFLPSDEQRLLRPQVLHFHCEGSAALKRALTACVVEKTREKGHLELWATNGTGRPDSLWARTFRTAGEWQKVGSIMKVSLG